MKLHFVCLLILFCWACHPKTESDVQLFDVEPERLSEKSFDQFYRLKEVIPLETTDSSIMSEISKVVAVKDRIFISTWDSKDIYSFKRNGKFIGKLSKQGRGPGEYQMIKDFVITQNPDRMVVYDLLGKLVYYDWNGNFLQEEKRDSHMSNLEYLPNGNWLFNHATWPTSTINDTAYIMRIADPEGKYLKGAFVLPKLTSPLPNMPSSLYKDNDYLYAAPLTENTIYKYNYQTNTFTPAYTFLMKKHPIPSPLESKDAQQPFFYDYYVFTCEYIGNKTVSVAASCLKEMKFLTLVADKKSGQVHVFPEVFEDKENELILNRYIQHTGFDGNMVVFARPIKMLENEFENSNSVGKKLCANLKEEDNPILVVYEEK